MRQQGREKRTRERERQGEGQGWQVDGFSMRVLARSGRTEREMNFGKREMADSPGLMRRKREKEKYGSPAISRCNNRPLFARKTPGTGEPPRYCFIQRGERPVSRKEALLLAPASLLRPPLAKARQKRGGCIALNPGVTGEEGGNRRQRYLIYRAQETY